MVAATGDCASSCKGQASKASYVAYGCDKSDQIARAAAKAYLTIMSELKKVNGADVCAMKTAHETLTAMLEEMQAERMAAAQPVVEVETVSFGVVSESPACDSACSSSKTECCQDKKN